MVRRPTFVPDILWLKALRVTPVPVCSVRPGLGEEESDSDEVESNENEDDELHSAAKIEINIKQEVTCAVSKISTLKPYHKCVRGGKSF
jgi:hypothetical protein